MEPSSDVGASPAAPGGSDRLRRFFSRDLVLLSTILLLAGAARVVALGTNPPGIYCDEAALGTNAKCLGETARSLKGDLLPLYVHEATFEMYFSYRIVYQPVYQYTLVAFVRAFGLSPFVVRLPSVFFGILGIAATYFLARTLFDGTTGLLAAGLLAISPWHHHYSRIAFEVISLTPFLALGFHFLFRGLGERRSAVAGASVLALATYTYPAARLFVPILVLGFAAIHGRELLAAKKTVLLASLAALGVGLPNLYLLLTDPQQGRMHDLFIWNADISGERAVQFLQNPPVGVTLTSAILHHRGLLIPFVFLYNWASHLSPVFLFLSGDDRAIYAAQGIGMCYLFMAPLLGVGLAVLARAWREKKHRFLLFWFLTWPIPASLTIYCPHATRGMTNFPVIEIISAVGLVALLRTARRAILPPRERSWKVTLASIVAFFVVLRMPYEVVAYAINYHRDFPVYAGQWFDAGIGEAFRSLKKERRPDEEIVISPKVHNAFLNILFFGDVDYRSLDPSLPDHRGLVPRPYHIAWEDSGAKALPKALWLVREEEKDEHLRGRVVRQIPYPDGKPNLLLVRYPAR
jgi:hypothetical protein